MNEDKNKNQEIEVLDLTDEKKEDSKVENNLEKRKDTRIIIISLASLIACVILLPTLTKIFDKDSNQNYSGTVNNNSSSNLVNGFIQVDKTDGNIVLNDIKFYNFIKRDNNIIRFNYKADSPIKNVQSLSIFIEIYNKSENIIYREQFFPSEKIEKGPVLSDSIELNPLIYKEAHYIKIVKISNENVNADSYLTCTQEFIDDVYNVNYKIKYKFGKNALLGYDVTKKVTINEPEDNDIVEGEIKYDKYNDIFLQEEADISNTNVTDYKREDNYLEYKIDLRKLDLEESDYKILYEIGTVERTIKLIEESKNWSCVNE